MINEDASQESMSSSDYLDEAQVPPAKKGSGFIRAVRRTLVFLFKLVLFVAVIAAIVAVVFYVWPTVYARYVQPVENNIVRVDLMETTQQASQAQLAALQTQLPALAATHAAALTALPPQMAALESTSAARSQAQLEAQAGFATQQASEIAGLAPRLLELESASKKAAQALSGLQSTQTSLQAADARGQVSLERQVVLLKSMELLSRARLFLYQSNFGLAKQDVQAARDQLAGLQAAVAEAEPMPGEPDAAALAEILMRLDLALGRLPEFPVPASDDLDIAWQILMGGMAQPGNAPLSPAAVQDTPASTPQAAATAQTPQSTVTQAGPTATPTPQATGTPRPTP